MSAYQPYSQVCIDSKLSPKYLEPICHIDSVKGQSNKKVIAFAQNKRQEDKCFMWSLLVISFINLEKQIEFSILKINYNHFIIKTFNQQ
jgi:hypothetical protein